MAEGRPVGTMFAELDLDLTRFERNMKRAYELTTSGTQKFEDKFRQLGIRSDRYYESQRQLAKKTYDAIVSDARATAKDRLNARKALHDRIAYFNREETVGYKTMFNQQKEGWASVTRAVLRYYAAFYVISNGIRNVINISRELYEASAKAAQIGKAYSEIAGSAELAAKEMGFLRDVSDALGQNFWELQGSYKNLLAASKGTNLEGQKTRDIFEAITKASATLGLASDKTKLSLYAIEQMISKGVVSSEELRRQLGDNLPGAFATAAKAMNMSTKELLANLKAGKVLTEDFIPKFAAALKEKYSGEVVESVAATNKFKEAIEDLKVEIGKGEFLEGMTKALQEITNLLKDEGVISDLKSLADAIGSVAEASIKLYNAWKKLDNLKPDWMEKALPFLGPLSGGNTAKDIILGLSNAVNEVHDYIKDKLNDTGFYGTGTFPVTATPPWANEVTQMFEGFDLGPKLEPAITTVQTLTDWLDELATSLGDVTVDAGEFSDAVDNWSEGISDQFEMLKIDKPTIDLANPIITLGGGKTINQILAEGFDTSTDFANVTYKSGGAFAGPVMDLTFIGHYEKDQAAEDYEEFLESVRDRTTDTFSAIMTGQKNLWAATWDWIGDYAGNALSLKISDALGGKFFANLLGGITGGIVGGLISKIGSLFSHKKTIYELGGLPGAYFQYGSTDIGGYADLSGSTGGWASIGNKTETAIQKTVDSVWDWAEGVISELPDKVQEKVNAVLSQSGLWSGIEGLTVSSDTWQKDIDTLTTTLHDSLTTQILDIIDTTSNAMSAFDIKEAATLKDINRWVAALTGEATPLQQALWAVNDRFMQWAQYIEKGTPEFETFMDLWNEAIDATKAQYAETTDLLEDVADAQEAYNETLGDRIKAASLQATLLGYSDQEFRLSQISSRYGWANAGLMGAGGYDWKAIAFSLASDISGITPQWINSIAEKLGISFDDVVDDIQYVSDTIVDAFQEAAQEARSLANSWKTLGGSASSALSAAVYSTANPFYQADQGLISGPNGLIQALSDAQDAFGGSTDISGAQKIVDLANQLLQVGQDYYQRPSKEYAEIYEIATGYLSEYSDRADFYQNTLDAQASQLEAIESVSDVIGVQTEFLGLKLDKIATAIGNISLNVASEGTGDTSTGSGTSTVAEPAWDPIALGYPEWLTKSKYEWLKSNDYLYNPTTMNFLKPGWGSPVGYVPMWHSGIDYVPQDTLAYLQKGERVISAKDNKNHGDQVVNLSLTIHAVEDKTDAIMKEVRKEVPYLIKVGLGRKATQTVINTTGYRRR